MLDGVRVFLRGLNSVRLQGYTYIWANLAFVALSLPVVTMPAALSALFRVSHSAYTDPSEADLALFWDTFKENLLRALPWGVVSFGFIFINIANLTAYTELPGFMGYALRVIWVVALLLWLAVLLYTWPIYYEMSEPRLVEAARNAFVMVLQNPFFTMTILFCLGILLVISTILVALWVLLTCGVIAAVSTAAVLDRLGVYRELHAR
jgi:uncharacterized membrane protein YesL